MNYFFMLSRKLGLNIGYAVCDYGLVILHYGTIIVGNTNRIGAGCKESKLSRLVFIFERRIKTKG